MANETESKVKIKVEAEMDDAIAEFERLAKAQAKASAESERMAKSAKLTSGKIDELGKSMVGLQINDTFNRASKSISEFTGGVVDLNAAFAGYQAAGPWGAAIGAVGGALAKAVSITSAFKDELKELEAVAARNGKGSGQGLGGLTDELYRASESNLDKAILAAKAAFTEANGAAITFSVSLERIVKAGSQLNGDIDKILAASKGVSDLDYQLEILRADAAGTPMKSKVRGAPGDFLGGFAGGVTGKQTGKGGEESDAQRKARLRGMLGGQSTDSGPRGAASPVNIFDSGQQQKASSNLDEFGRQRDELSNLNNELEKTAAWKAELTASRAKGQSFMESVFGKLGEVDLYKSAFDGLTGAVTAGYDAMVDGTMSFGAAFKKSIADSLKSLGGQMLVEALKETAYGIASLARYDYGGAALHFKSAAAFGVGAVAAGAASAGLGGGGGVSGNTSRASAGAPSVSGGGGGGGPQQSGPTYIIQTNPWSADDTPRMKRNQIDKILASSSQARN